jgi:hypothetical protein
MKVPKNSKNLNPFTDKPTSPVDTETDYVTVLTVAGRANKLVKKNKDGTVGKKPGPPISEATAQTFRVSNIQDMVVLQKEIGKTPNQVLSLGFVPGTGPKDGEAAGEPYRVVSKPVMGKALGIDPETPEGLEAVLGWHKINGERCICRLRVNMVPSSWCLFDIDAVRGMPDHIASMDSDERRGALAEIIPGFADAGVVIVPSTTGRVLVDGEPMDATGEHYYLQIQNAADLERFGATLLQRTMLAGFGFMKPNYSTKEPDKIVGHTPWGIADSTTFSHERLIYDGSPTVKGEGLEVAKAVINVREGRRLDTSLLLDLTDEEVVAYANKTGQRVVRKSRTESVTGADGKVVKRQFYSFSAIDDRLLKMDTSIETQVGTMTIKEYMESDHGKLRCQTPFRDSSSWNGILNRHADGSPFVYDNGLRCRYVLSGTDVVARLNEEYFVTWAGNKVVVGRWNTYEGRRSLTLIKPTDLHTWCANDRIVIDDKQVVVSKLWITSPKRRQYNGIEFAPDGKTPDGYLNIWQGFSVEPDPSGSCTLFLNHMRWIVCSGEADLYEWVMVWLAQMIQEPGDKTGTAVVLRGGQGVGKTIVGRIVGHLFADHHVVVSRSSHITGRFNKHLNQCLLLQAEEAFWAGSKDAEGTLKDLITGETQLLEGKGVDAIPIRNVLRLLVTTNSEWAVPAGMQDRRFAVFDVSQGRQQDVAYFKALIDEMENGGYEALLHHLQNLDIYGVNLRQPPRTDALVEQVLASMPVEQSWWLEVLQQGKIKPFDKEWDAKFTFQRMHEAYTEHAKELGLRRPLTKELLGRRIRKFTHIDEHRPDNTKTREYWLQPLENCRRTFDAFLGVSISWSDIEVQKK